MDDQQLWELPIAKSGSPLDGKAKLFPKDQRTPWEFDTPAQAELIAQQRQAKPRSTELPKQPFDYLLPKNLLKPICSHVDTSRFDKQALQNERDLTARSTLHGQVGYWGTWNIVSDLLEDSPPLQKPDDFKPADFGTTKDRLQAAMAAANERLTKVTTHRIGYAGWLVLNRQFIDEHDALLRQYRDRFLAEGFPMTFDSTDVAAPRRFRRAFPLMQNNRPNDASAFILEADTWLNDYQRFCERWRLSHLAGPYLPEPLMPQIPLGVGPAPGTQVFVFPDIYPIIGRGFIGEVVEDALRGGSSEDREHLLEWFQIAGNENSARNTISRFGRLLRLQHYWRILHQRHADALVGQKGKLQNAFAEYFGLSEESLKRDLQEIQRQLGPDWSNRPDPLVDAGGEG